MKIDWHPEAITAQIEKAAMDRLEKAGEVVAAKARQLVPVRSGKLKDSIRVTRLKGDAKQNIRVYAGNRDKGGAFYAHMVEYGSVHNDEPRKSFLRPALNGSGGDIMNIMENGNG